ncbi:DNA/RNA nuclease SfsA [Desulfofalx alkaliphila]|uniref:DNA/RNA nuclease SfsA n=1 Tax=Desulfofalx alkaliphila TaxID=105483 RepID=UPI0004E12ED7|nr:DNA/RNA nuclease SfsA [Desulfofalx alkaliphila]
MTQIKVADKLIEAVFNERLNRFVAIVTIGGRSYRAHVPSSGRMGELLVPGVPVLVTPGKPGGRTDFKLLMVRYQSHWVSIDSLLPNRLVKEALLEQQLPALQGYRSISPEQKFGGSRFDFFLQQGHQRDCYIEVKSVTLVEEGMAKFPDAPSERGTKHLLDLVRAVQQGYRGVVLFVVQRTDASSFAPNTPRDRKFSDALAYGIRCGVEVYAWRCALKPPYVALTDQIPLKVVK